ncbi:GNAT family N-acetyltransferase [Thiolapillus brandeum]|uniref:Phosphinothricin acetyltransferase n=1 Tax=Thiolapillus brandeum TaxID=1076588 RepID=A0A7U6GJE5_9GAMM|nr:GNAT family N-acetyltransferase [Thiolapillus brandeum]BAO44717.1 phosphinothricin acetyltransferase [Thiolapillus brandeum]
MEHTTITFEERLLEPQDFARRIGRVAARYPWLVLEENGKTIGYAYASEWKSRSAFRYTVESSIYLHPQAPRRQDCGKVLYGRLLSLLAREGYHKVIAAVTQPNDASMALHHGFGFVTAGYFHEVGYKFHDWIDVAYLELGLEKPSNGVY